MIQDQHFNVYYEDLNCQMLFSLKVGNIDLYRDKNGFEFFFFLNTN